MGGLRVLITSITLAERTGPVMYVRDLAMGLLDRGHTPIVYSTELGQVAQEIRAATIPVIDDLDVLTTPPDIIHGNQHPETMTALLRFPVVPAVHTCHGWGVWEDAPAVFPRILRYIAVDFACYDRLVFGHGIPEERVRVLFNSVDLKRFKSRGPLPVHPKRALVFSNYANEQTHLAAVRTACARAGVTLDVVGEAAGNPCVRPDAVLGEYDLVFAKARCALEAMTVGAAVVLCDTLGAGPMVTTSELDRLRRLNFGRRALCEPVSPDVLAREIARYDPIDAAEVSRRLRATAGLENAVDELLALYQEVLEERMSPGGANDAREYRATATYLRWLSHNLLRQSRQLHTITNTVGWRLLIRYGSIKHRFVLPPYRRLLRLLRVGTPDRRGRS